MHPSNVRYTLHASGTWACNFARTSCARARFANRESYRGSPHFFIPNRQCCNVQLESCAVGSGHVRHAAYGCVRELRELRASRPRHPAREKHGMDVDDRSQRSAVPGNNYNTFDEFVRGGVLHYTAAFGPPNPYVPTYRKQKK